MRGGLAQRDWLELAVDTALATAALARLVGSATEQLGARVGSSGAGAIQSAFGNLPELFIALFALNAGLVGVVQAALVGSVLANSLLVLGIAFTVGGLRNGVQHFNMPRTRLITTLASLGATILAIPTLAHAFHTPAAMHGKTLSFVCAVVVPSGPAIDHPGLLRGLGEEV